MALQVKAAKRVFELSKNGKTIQLSDINPEMKIEEVSDFYSSKYPELLNSVYEKNEKDGNLVITFKTVAGTKG